MTELFEERYLNLNFKLKKISKKISLFVTLNSLVYDWINSIDYVVSNLSKKVFDAW